MPHWHHALPTPADTAQSPGVEGQILCIFNPVTFGGVSRQLLLIAVSLTGGPADHSAGCYCCGFPHHPTPVNKALYYPAAASSLLYHSGILSVPAAPYFPVNMKIQTAETLGIRQAVNHTAVSVLRRHKIKTVHLTALHSPGTHPFCGGDLRWCLIVISGNGKQPVFRPAFITADIARILSAVPAAYPHRISDPSAAHQGSPATSSVCHHC